MWFLLHEACVSTKYWLRPAQQFVQLKYSFRQGVAKQILTVKGELHKEGSGHGLRACTPEAFQTLGVHL